jgi:hypothetical protein
MTSPHYSSDKLAFQLRIEDISDQLLRFVLLHLHALAQAEQETPTTSTSTTSFWPLGSYLFCSQEGAICVDNALSVVKMMHLMLITASPSSSIEDHLKYGDYVGKVCVQFLNQRSFMQAHLLPESSYEAGVALALQSSGIDSQVYIVLMPSIYI